MRIEPDEITAGITLSGIQDTVEGDMIFRHPVGDQVFGISFTTKFFTKDILKANIKFLVMHRLVKHHTSICFSGILIFMHQVLCKSSSSGVILAVFSDMYFVGLANSQFFYHLFWDASCPRIQILKMRYESFKDKSRCEREGTMVKNLRGKMK